MSEPTIRERIDAFVAHLSSDEATPVQYRTALEHLTALWGELCRDARAKEFAYRKVLAQHMAGDGTAARAKVIAEATEEYAAFREAKGLADEVDQRIITCRRSLQSLDNEYRRGA